MKKGLLLINLGTPDAADVASVRRYLKQFLLDERVIDLPFLLRWILVKCLIVPFRARRSTHAYQSIWTREGSPLLLNSQNLVKKVESQLGDDYRVEMAMRYGQPSIEQKLDRLGGCQSISVIPLFPQYSSAATGSPIESVMQHMSKWQNIPSLSIINHFFEHPGFIKAISRRIGYSGEEFILFSYHGLPERQIVKGGCKTVCDSPCAPDKLHKQLCYRAQCYQTSRLIAQALDLKVSDYATSFQSRLGKTPWIRPYTDETLITLANKGIKNISIVCPSFVADCLETLEEIGIEAKQQWSALGGQGFRLVPCLNDDDIFVDALCDMVK